MAMFSLSCPRPRKVWFMVGTHGFIVSLVILFFAVAVGSAVGEVKDQDRWAQAERAIERGIEYLRGTQGEDGSWTPQAGPAVTAMVVGVMLDQPDVSVNDPAVEKGLRYVLSKVKEDGGIHDGVLENYNTAICLGALARVNDRPEVAAVIEKAQGYLRSVQWSEESSPTGQKIDRGHAFYGGAGYGKHGRPDMSNTQIMLEGLYESGLDCNDPAFVRAMVFISRCQGTKANREFGDRIVQDGGFIYATSIDKDHVGVPQSMASPEKIDEAMAGRSVSGLRTYGSMTYAGFKSYLYAQLERDDPRVVDAYNWIRRNFTLEQNPGMPEALKMDGYFYYLVTFSRALRAWGEAKVVTEDGVEHDWAGELAAKLAGLQRGDGSWVNPSDRWMESDPDLTTAYALTALTEAMK